VQKNNSTKKCAFRPLRSFLKFCAVLLPHALNCICKVLFLALSVTLFLFVNQISRERLNGFAPNSQGRRVWFLARSNEFDVKVKCQGHQGRKTRCALPSPPEATEWSRLLHAIATHYTALSMGQPACGLSLEKNIFICSSWSKLHVLQHAASKRLVTLKET